MIAQQDCRHPKLRFEDGDDHIVCPADLGGCGLTWAVVNKSTLGEFAQPELADEGVGATLTGQLRVEPTP